MFGGCVTLKLTTYQCRYSLTITRLFHHEKFRLLIILDPWHSTESDYLAVLLLMTARCHCFTHLFLKQRPNNFALECSAVRLCIRAGKNFTNNFHVRTIQKKCFFP